MTSKDKNNIWLGSIIGAALFGIIYWFKSSKSSLGALNPDIIKWTE